MSEESGSSPTFIRQLTGVRFVAAFWVLMYHFQVPLAVLGLLRHLPMVGFLAWWGTTVVGLGAMTLEAWRRWRGPRAA